MCVTALDRVFASVHEEEAARAVGDLGLARLEAALALHHATPRHTAHVIHSVGRYKGDMRKGAGITINLRITPLVGLQTFDQTITTKLHNTYTLYSRYIKWQHA